jgi:hypothetical protein
MGEAISKRRGEEREGRRGGKGRGWSSLKLGGQGLNETLIV